MGERESEREEKKKGLLWRAEKRLEAMSWKKQRFSRVVTGQAPGLAYRRVFDLVFYGRFSLVFLSFSFPAKNPQYSAVNNNAMP